jgi:hypothetical protein
MKQLTRFINDLSRWIYCNIFYLELLPLSQIFVVIYFIFELKDDKYLEMEGVIRIACKGDYKWSVIWFKLIFYYGLQHQI